MTYRDNQFSTNPPSHRSDASANHSPQIFRMKAKEEAVKGDKGVWRCVLTNGSTDGQQDYFVRIFGDHKAGDDIYAFQPFGGTDALYHQKPVTWIEVGQSKKTGDGTGGSGAKGQAWMTLDDNGTVGWAYPFFVDV